jgi:hypothetical protein
VAGPLGVAKPPFHFLFFLKNKFIYLFLLINLYFFYSDGQVLPSYWFDVALTGT